MSPIRIGYIRDFRTDLIWFMGLPFLAIAVGLSCQQWLPLTAVASIALWITIPHHFATWARTYGMREDWQRFKSRLIVGPLVIASLTLLGVKYAPLSMFLLVILWDHQHSLMQQHGLARIYDFKARAGARSTGRFDLFLGIFLFGNMLITAPLWTEFWVFELYRWNLAVGAETVRTIHLVSWIGTGAYVCIYLGHVFWCGWQGYSINPAKYVFIISSYTLWYYASWHTNSFVVFAVSHRIMHGLQYILIVYWYFERKAERTSERPWIMPTLSMTRFFLLGITYAFFYQLIILNPLDEFGFGISNFLATQGEIPIKEGTSSSRAYDLYAATVVNSVAVIHYYFDSFIWKVSDAKTQEGL